MFDSNFTGALLDERPPEDKVNDISLSDIVGSANAVNWTNKSPRTFPIYNQNQSFMCGANALSKALGIAFNTTYGTYLTFSRADIYQRRFNRPGAGMALYDMFSIASGGVTLEQLTPKEILTDNDAESLVIENFKHEVGKVFSISSGGIYPPNDIEAIASVIQTTGKGVILLTYFLTDEYSKELPVQTDSSLTSTENRALRHFIVAVDYTLINGQKYLWCEDSAHFGGFNKRLISESWIKNRVIQTGYPMNFKFTSGGTVKPVYDGVTITSAQKCLRYEGLFPTNIAFVENLGPVTKKAIIAFQLKYGIQQTGTLGPITQGKLHTLYSWYNDEVENY